MSSYFIAKVVRGTEVGDSGEFKFVGGGGGGEGRREGEKQHRVMQAEINSSA